MKLNLFIIDGEVIKVNSAIRWIRELSRKKIYNDKDMIELFKYDNTSLWWLVEPWLDNKNKYFPTVSEYLENSWNLKNKNIDKSIGKVLLKHSFNVKSKIRKIIVGKNPINYSEILITTHSVFLQGNENVRMENVITEFEKRYSTSVIYYDDLASLGLKTRLQRIKNRNVNAIELFCDKKVLQIINSRYKYYKSVWNKIKISETFKKLIDHNNKSVYDGLKERFEFVFTRMIYEAIYYVETTKNAIKLIKPKLIIMMGGPTLQCKAIAIASKYYNLSCMEIQEGLIDSTIYHTYSKDDILRGYIKPDKIAVYGDYTKKQLLNFGGYSENEIVIVGQPNTDKFFNTFKDINKLNKKEKLNELKIHGKKVVLYAPVSNLSKDVALYVIKSIVKAFENTEYSLFIKPHPRDEYIKEYLKIINNKKNVALRQDYNIYEAIILSDIVIAFSNCTVIMETLILNKKIIGIMPSDKIQFKLYDPYVKSGAVLLLNNLSKIYETTHNLINNKELQKELDDNRNKFISRHLYRLDGKVCERIVKLGIGMMNK